MEDEGYFRKAVPSHLVLTLSPVIRRGDTFPKGDSRPAFRQMGRAFPPAFSSMLYVEMGQSGIFWGRHTLVHFAPHLSSQAHIP